MSIRESQYKGCYDTLVRAQATQQPVAIITLEGYVENGNELTRIEFFGAGHNFTEIAGLVHTANRMIEQGRYDTPINPVEPEL